MLDIELAGVEQSNTKILSAFKRIKDILDKLKLLNLQRPHLTIPAAAVLRKIILVTAMDTAFLSLNFCSHSS